MPLPTIVVTLTAATPKRGADSPTGTAFLAYAGATGSTDPVRCRSVADATAADAPAPIATLVGDCLTQGAPEVILVRADAADDAAVTEAEWAIALDAFTDQYGVGQVLIPGVFSAAAHDALLDHAATHNRAALLDHDPEATATAIAATAAALAAADGAQRSTIVTGATLTGPGGTTRDVPGSVIAAGLAARGDVIAGHANNAPIRDQSRGIGFVRGAVAVPATYTGTEGDALNDAGVCVIGSVVGVVQLLNWVSLSDDPQFRQLNIGRGAMQIGDGVSTGVRQFLGRQLDGRGQLYAELEGLLRGYLQPLWTAGAIKGITPDDGYAVYVREINNETTANAGELRAAVEVALTKHTERVVIDVVFTEGIAA